MKKNYFIIFSLFFTISITSQVVYFADPNFKIRLTDGTSSATDINGDFLVIDSNDNNEIEVSEAAAVYTLSVMNSGDGLYGIQDISGIDSFVNLRSLNCSYNNIAWIAPDLPYLENLICIGNSIEEIYIDYCPNLKTINCSFNELTSLAITDLSNLESIIASDNQIGMVDLSFLPSLTHLECEYNLISTLDLLGMQNLQTLICNNNMIEYLDLEDCPDLVNVIVNNNYLLEVNLAGNENLTVFKCHYNGISNLDISDCGALEVFWCSNNALSALDLSNNNNIKELHCRTNSISTLELSNLEFLEKLWCDNNLLTTLDVTASHNMSILWCPGNDLVSLFMKNGSIETTLNFASNPDLVYICADDNQITTVSIMAIVNNPACTVNTYCSFVPGGIFYTLQGSNKFDADGNGCNASDIALPHLKFNVTNESIFGTIIPNANGNYSIPVQQGSHTVTPVINNPSYFTISPTSVTVSFPSDASPSIHNFCISPNGMHHDLSVALLPIGAAVPGFDVHYKIIVKNDGNQLESGTVNFSFDDSVMDFVSAPDGTASLNTVSFSFSNLHPFVTGSFDITMNLNTPTETPALILGDILTYSVTVAGSTDETPENNSQDLNQTVVNSMDPNHKTCIEGATIAPSMAGEYVHYIIEFENLGTFPAQNIVVKDMIDASKFDVATLVPIGASHLFVTRITETNKVEFIFEGINLPFDDVNNDGYVAFKIKTKPNLVVGNTFSNTASIYFDYNFPIVTNTATTTITALSNPDFEFGKFFTIHPNPANDILNMSSVESININSIAIYNLIGQQLIVIPNSQNVFQVDISTLTPGTYFVRVDSDKGISAAKFIKK